MGVVLVKAFKELTKPSRYKVYYGGRGGAKSYNFARILLLMAAEKKLRILCAREIQKSISDSVHRILSDQIHSMGLEHLYTITQKEIRSKVGSEFIFKGLKHNVLEIKSTEGVDICWVEEAEKVSDESWDVLIPTIRKPNSEIWISFNPHSADDATYRRFILNTPDNAIVKKVNYWDNPFFPDVLREEMEYMRRVDYERYRHIWEGECITFSDAQVFKNKFETDILDTQGCDEVYYGCDWGFSVDPTTLVRVWVVGNVLYIDQEAYKVGCSLDDTPSLFEKVDGAKEHKIRADSARPESINFMQLRGWDIVPAVKWSGSVEDGIEFIRSFERIIIHPDCIHAHEEFRMYSYKTNSAGDILPKVEDKHNHIIDAIRYALEPLIRKRFGLPSKASFRIGI